MCSNVLFCSWCVVAPGEGAGVYGATEEGRSVDRQHQHVRSMGNQVR